MRLPSRVKTFKKYFGYFSASSLYDSAPISILFIMFQSTIMCTYLIYTPPPTPKVSILSPAISQLQHESAKQTLVQR